MQAPLEALSSTVGAFFSNSSFQVPPYQREYSWQTDDIEEFFGDLQENISSDNYFLGLVILTDEGGRKSVVDGQQRIVTLTLLSTAIYFEAINRDRKALADRISADFLRSINYETDETDPRVVLSDPADNKTLQYILENGKSPKDIGEEDSVSFRIAKSFNIIRKELSNDLAKDPFKRLGQWTDFLTNRVYFAVFVHPDSATAYQVFEVINTRGRDLTTADLLKNFVLSQTKPEDQEKVYHRWRSLAQTFSVEGSNNTFVQFIRHVVTVHSGHILPRSLFSYLAQRERLAGKTPPPPNQLIDMLEQYHPLYQQMIDPTLPGPASE